MRTAIIFTILVFTVSFCCVQQVHAQEKPLPTYEQYIRANHPTKAELDGFLNSEFSWAKFDPELGYVRNNFMYHDGVNNSITLSTVQPNGTRTSFMYANKPCRINAYGDSFTQSEQVNDGEAWEEQLAAHLGEPIRNYGVGSYGVYQAYRRMLREEQTTDSAKYIIFYIWGDDHTRSLMRCRCMMFREFSAELDKTDGVGKTFSNNFWPNIEMDLNTGKLTEHENLLNTRQSLYKMTDPDWMWKNLKTDLALQMGLFTDNKISDVDVPQLKKLSQALRFSVDLDNPATLHENVRKLYFNYGFAATKYVLDKTKAFATKNGKKLLVVIFDPYNVTFPMLTGEVTNETRYDREIVDYLQTGGFTWFDMNMAHVEDYKDFKVSPQDYFKRYFIGHYNPTGYHFFATSIAPKVIDWLEPKPLTYRKTDVKMVDFKKYLDMKTMDNK